MDVDAHGEPEERITLVSQHHFTFSQRLQSYEIGCASSGKKTVLLERHLKSPSVRYGNPTGRHKEILLCATFAFHHPQSICEAKWIVPLVKPQRLDE